MTGELKRPSTPIPLPIELSREHFDGTRDTCILLIGGEEFGNFSLSKEWSDAQCALYLLSHLVKYVPRPKGSSHEG